MRRALRFAAIVCALVACALDTRAANSPSPLDQPPNNVLPTPVEIAPSAPAEQAPRAAEPSGNPLWAVPLSALSATRDRPLFTPSRRAPAPVVAGPVAAAPPPPPPPPSEPERPQLTLVGAIVGSNEGIAVFLDQTNNNVIRLRTGQDHLGWVLRSVKGREATLEKNQQSTTLELPAPGTAQALGTPSLAIPGMPAIPMVPRGPFGPGGKQKEPEL
jgi:hypothetical protein